MSISVVQWVKGQSINQQSRVKYSTHFCFNENEFFLSYFSLLKIKSFFLIFKLNACYTLVSARNSLYAKEFSKVWRTFNSSDENFCCFYDLLDLLVDWVFNSLTLRAKPLSLFPSQLLQHLVAQVITCQLEIFVVWKIWLPAFLQCLWNHFNN